MAMNTQNLKGRIQSIKSTKKITKAMELISNVKLQKEKTKLSKNSEYVSLMNDILEKMSNFDTNHPYFQKNSESLPKLLLVFGSDMGLCGGYNINLIKAMQPYQGENVKCFVFGRKIYQTLKNQGFSILNDVFEIEALSYEDIKKYCLMILEQFQNREISSFECLYTQFVNSVTFKTIEKKILPLQSQEAKTTNVLLEFEPNEDMILNHFVPLAITSEVYTMFLQSRTSEQASRRLAMESASDNAQELIDNLTIKYNQARQAMITQEISEIVNGANAL